MGLFSIDGTNTATSHAELSKAYKAQAQKYATQEKAMIEFEEFEAALNEKDKTIECMTQSLKEKGDQIQSLETENSRIKD